MKLKSIIKGISLALFLISCATPSSIIMQEDETGIDMTELSALHEETVLPSTVHETPVPSLFDLALFLVRQNPPELIKYFFLDENREIVVMAELFNLAISNENEESESEVFEVIYHIAHFQATEAEGFAGGFFVPYTITSISTGEQRQDVFLWQPVRDASGVLLSFDDDYFDNWEAYFDLFEYHNARVTFFVQGKINNDEASPEPQTNDIAENFYEDELLDILSFSITALERGHDIGYHTISHPDLRWISLDDFMEETVNQSLHFREAGIGLSSFAYTFGFSEPWMHDILSETFDILRGYGVTYRLYNSGEIRNNFISSRAIDTILFREDEAFIRAMNIMLRTVKFIGGDLVLPITTHEISEDAAWGITAQRLDFLLEEINKLQLNFYTFNDFAGR